MIKRALFFLFLFLATCTLSYGQAVQVMPIPYDQFLDGSGQPLGGGLLFTYAAGTTTPQVTYADSTGTVPNSNPIVLDSAGRASVWLSSLSYKFVLESSSGEIQWSQDNVSVGVFQNANNNFTGTNTFSGTTTFNGPVNLNAGGSLSGTFSGNPNFSGLVTFSQTPSFAFGFPNINLPSNGTICWPINECIAFNGTSLTIPNDSIAGTILTGAPLALNGIHGNSTTGSGPGQGISLLAGVGDMNFSGGSIVETAGAATGTAVGGAVSLTSGASGATSGDGGAFTLAAGGAIGTAVGTGGAVSLAAGNTAANSGKGGAVTIQSGNTTSMTATGPGGLVTIAAGNSSGATGDGGTVSILSGDASNTTGAGNGGSVGLAAGDALGSGAGAGGSVSIVSGNSMGTGNGGAIGLTSGTALGTNGTGGAVTLVAGAGIGTGNGGNVSISAGAVAGSGTSGNVAVTGAGGISLTGRTSLNLPPYSLGTIPTITASACSVIISLGGGSWAGAFNCTHPLNEVVSITLTPATPAPNGFICELNSITGGGLLKQLSVNTTNCQFSEMIVAGTDVYTYTIVQF